MAPKSAPCPHAEKALAGVWGCHVARPQVCRGGRRVERVRRDTIAQFDQQSYSDRNHGIGVGIEAVERVSEPVPVERPVAVVVVPEEA